MFSNYQSKIFEEQLIALINNSGLSISEAYYIVENASLRLKLLREDLINIEKQEMLKEASEEKIEIKLQGEEKGE